MSPEPFDGPPPGFLGRAEFVLPDELAELAAAADRLGRERLAPAVRQSESDRSWPEEAMTVLDGMPLTGLDLDESLGGAGAGVLAACVVREAIARHDAGGLLAADRLGGASAALRRCPDRELARRVVADCSGGDRRAALTVVDETTSNRVAWMPSWPEPGWVVASDDDTARLHEVTGGAGVGEIEALAFQASGGVEVDLGAAPVRAEWAMGDGGGAEVRAPARLLGAAIAVGVAAAALDETIEYTTDRVVFGKPVAHHQGNAFDLAHAAARIHGARLLVRYAATQLDEGHPDGSFWANQAWLETMDAAFVATDTGIQLLGGHGFLVDHLAEKRFREARHLALQVGGRDWAEHDVAGPVLDVADLLAPEGIR